MIYALLLCHLASGNCSHFEGPMPTIYNSLAECELYAGLHNRGLDMSIRKAVCFEKPGWRPAR